MLNYLNDLNWNILTGEIKHFRNNKWQKISMIEYDKLNKEIDNINIIYFKVKDDLYGYKYNIKFTGIKLLSTIKNFYKSHSKYLSENPFLKNITQYKDGLKVELTNIDKSKEKKSKEKKSKEKKVIVKSKSSKNIPIKKFTKPKLYPSQINNKNKTINIFKEFDCSLNTAPMGTGKTYSTCAIADELKLGIFVIAPKTLLSKWKEVINKFGIKIYEIINYERIVGRTKSGSSYLIRDGNSFKVNKLFKNAVNNGILFVVDECHNAKNMSLKTTAVQTFIRYIVKANEKRNTNSRIALISATPADKKEHALNYSILLGLTSEENLYTHSLDEINLTGLKDVYNKALEIDKVKAIQLYRDNLNSVNDITEVTFSLITEIFIPRMTTTMPWLNKGIYINGFLILKNNQEMYFDALQLLNETFSKTRISKVSKKSTKKDEEEDIEKEKEGRDVAEKGNFGGLTYALSRIERSKINDLIELIIEELNEDPSKKIIIYLRYYSNIDLAINLLKEYSPLQLDGRITVNNRDKNITLFQEPNSKHRILIGNPMVGGVGIDLDDKNGNFPRNMYISPGYDFISLYQAAGRINRIDSKSEGTTYFIYGSLNDEVKNVEEVIGYSEVRILESLKKKSDVAGKYLINDDHPPFPSDFDDYIL